MATDWFSWLSKTGLDPSLIYDYGVAFARNELQLQDANYFNHEFLQSMGVSIAKHRLEILKLAKKESKGGLHKAMIKAKKCLKKCVTKLAFREEGVKDISEPIRNNYQEELWRGALVRTHKGEEFQQERQHPFPIHKARSLALSGPLDGRVHERLAGNKILKLSGPLDGRAHEKMLFARSPMISRPTDVRCPERLMSIPTMKSPKLSGPLDGRMAVGYKSPRCSGALDGRSESPMVCGHYNKAKVDGDYDDDDHSLWTALFQDMKPT